MYYANRSLSCKGTNTWVNTDCPVGQYFDEATLTCDSTGNVDCGTRNRNGNR